MKRWIDRPSLLLAALALLVVPLHAQDDKEAKKPDPEVAAKLETFTEAVKKDKKFERDQEAIGIIDELLKIYPDMHPKDQRDFLRALDSVFTPRHRKPELPSLYKATVFALGEIKGPDAAGILVKYIDRKPFDDKDWLSLQEDMLENIGRCHDEKQIDYLTKKAKQDPTDGIKRAAGKALRHFEDLELPVRKEIFSDLLIYYAKIEGDSKSSLDTGDAVVATAKRTYAAIADPWNQTLAALSGQSFRTAEEWQHWYNKNKNDAKAWK